jgi:hypothetical protein
LRINQSSANGQANGSAEQKNAYDQGGHLLNVIIVNILDHEKTVHWSCLELAAVCLM